MVDGNQFAKLVDISYTHVKRLTAKGVLVHGKKEDGSELRNRYELADNIKRYCHYLREQAKLDDVSESKYVMLRNKKMGAESEMSVLKLMLFKNTLHRGEDVEFHVTNMLTGFRARVLAIPSRTARLLVGQTKFQTIYDLLMQEIELALKELVEYDPKQFEAASRAFLEAQGADESQVKKNGTSEESAEDRAA